MGLGAPELAPLDPVDGFSWNVVFEDVSKIFWGNNVWLKSDNNNWYVHWRSMYMFDNVSLSSAQNEMCFIENQNTHF